jgi:hypothetical protein
VAFAYVVSLVLVAVGLLLLGLFLAKPLRALPRFRSAQAAAIGDVRDRAGLLKARTAGVRVAIAERLRRPSP